MTRVRRLAVAVALAAAAILAAKAALERVRVGSTMATGMPAYSYFTLPDTVAAANDIVLARVEEMRPGPDIVAKVPGELPVPLDGQAVEVRRRPSAHGYATAERVACRQSLSVPGLPDARLPVDLIVL